MHSRTIIKHPPARQRFGRAGGGGSGVRGKKTTPEVGQAGPTQSKNGPEDLMGHHGEVGWDGLGRKMKIKPEIIWASTEHGPNWDGLWKNSFSNFKSGIWVQIK
jgi:hypothetical protein